jgi:diguanylate cyclase (GGDEF)-like protein/PAS domain S-box-containing protein
VGRRLAILLIPASIVLLAWTNELHGWLWSSFRQGEFGRNTAIFEHGPAYALALITGYALVGVICSSLWKASRNGSELTRRQARLLFMASLVPVAGNLAYLFQPAAMRGVDWSSITFSGAGVMFLIALYGTRLLDLSPIAHDELVRGLADGMIVLDTHDRVVEINEPALDMLGPPHRAVLGHPLAELSAPVQATLDGDPARRFRAEITIETASRRYLDVVVSPLLQDRETPIGRLIVLRDISELVERGLRLQQLTQAVEQSPSSVVITDLRGTIEYVNTQFRHLTGYAAAEVVGRRLATIDPALDPESDLDLWPTVLGGRTWQGERLGLRADGEPTWELVVAAPLIDAGGNVLSCIVVKQDIDYRKKAEEALRLANERLAGQLEKIESLQATLQEQAIRDPLTRLHNRRFFDEVIDREIHRAARLAQSVSIVTMDLDGFKGINDGYGHAAGDACLVRFAELLRAHVRRSDIACRYGGEEFLLVLGDTELEGAVQFAEKVRRRVAATPVMIGGQRIEMTVSAGVATYPMQGLEHREIVEKADRALYRAKREGRDRVVAWSDEIDAP